MTSMAGPVKDQNPPISGDTNTWTFTNDTGEPIHDLRIVVDGPWWRDVPDIREVTITDEDGNVIFQSQFTDELTVHCVFTTDLPPGKKMRVKVRCQQQFDPYEYIQFSPSATDGSNIIASIASIESSPSVASAGIGGPGQAALGYAIASSPTGPDAVLAAMRKNERLIAALSSRRSWLKIQRELDGSAGPVAEHQVGAAVLVREGDTLQSIAKSVLRARLGREATDFEISAMVTRLDRDNNISEANPLKPGKRITLS